MHEQVSRCQTAIRRVWLLAYATYRFTRAHVPAWVLPVLGVCLLIPGPFDELLVILLAAGIIIKSKRNRHIYARYVRATRGSK